MLEVGHLLPFLNEYSMLCGPVGLLASIIVRFYPRVKAKTHIPIYAAERRFYILGPNIVNFYLMRDLVQKVFSVQIVTNSFHNE